MIRVLVVAGSAIVRAGLESLLRSDPQVEVGGSTPAAPQITEGLSIDVVVADIDDSPPIDDLLAASATAEGPGLVALTSDPQPFATADLLRSGARAVLPRDVPAAELAAAVVAAANRLVVLHAEDARSLLGATDHASSGVAMEQLSPREIEVLRMLADGLPNKTVAWKLGISEHTVKYHVASIMAKLGAASRTEAVTIGLRRGLILL